MNNKIQIFFNSIKDAKKYVDVSSNIQNIHRYLIYFSLLDILGKYAFPNEKSHCERYKQLIWRYSSWKYKNYISSLQLECILK